MSDLQMDFVPRVAGGLEYTIAVQRESHAGDPLGCACTFQAEMLSIPMSARKCAGMVGRAGIRDDPLGLPTAITAISAPRITYRLLLKFRDKLEFL